MGSADWMNRNVYSRIEVCFPINDVALKAQMLEIVELQWLDNVAAVGITENDMNLELPKSEDRFRSQQSIYKLVTTIP